MKKTLLGLALLVSALTTAQNYSAASLLNLDLNAGGQLIDYEKLIEIDLDNGQPDTLLTVEVQRNFEGELLEAREIDYLTKDTAEWSIQTMGNQTTVSVPGFGSIPDTLFQDIFTTNNAGQDSSWLSLFNMGSGLVPVQEVITYFTGTNLDSVYAYDLSSGTRTLVAKVKRSVNANGQTDSIKILAFIGVSFRLVQFTTYHYTNNRLDSALLFDAFTSTTQPVEKLNAVTNSNGEVTQITFLAEDQNTGEFTPYLRIVFIERADISVSENPLASINIMPNPVANSFSHNYNQALNLTLTDGAGRVVWSKNKVKANEPQNINQLPKGIYYLSLENQKFNHSQKLVKN